MEIRPLAAKVTANGNGNKTTVGNAQVVYICATADDLITNVTTSATMQVHENQAFVLHKAARRRSACRHYNNTFY